MYRESYFRVGRDVPVEAEFTRKFQVVQDRNEEMKATLMAVYAALKEKGITPSIRLWDTFSPKTPPISQTTTMPAR